MFLHIFLQIFWHRFFALITWNQCIVYNFYITCFHHQSNNLQICHIITKKKTLSFSIVKFWTYFSEENMQLLFRTVKATSYLKRINENIVIGIACFCIPAIFIQKCCKSLDILLWYIIVHYIFRYKTCSFILYICTFPDLFCNCNFEEFTSDL